MRERSLLSRFAVSRPTQATEVDDLTVSVLCVHEGHTGSAETNATTDEALRDVAARAGRRRARRGGCGRRAGRLPGPAGAGARAPATTASTRSPRSSTPARPARR